MSRIKKIVYLILFISALALVLIEINYLGLRYNLRFDLTRSQQHTLTPLTQKLIKDIRENIQITALIAGIPPQYLEDLMKEYERISKGKIKTKIIDPLVDIGYAARFGNVIDQRQSKAVIQSGKERSDIDFTDEPLTEADLNRAIMKVTRKPRSVYFLTGHGEYSITNEKEEGLTILADLLEQNNIVSKSLMLGIKDRVPADCDLLIVAGPRDFLSEKEEKMINEYLQNGGDALFLIENVIVTTPEIPLTDDQKKRNPSLNSLLNRWGVKIADDIVVDLASHASGDVGSPATRNYMPHKAIIHDLDYTFYIRPRSISMVKDRPESIRLVPLVLTASEKDSWGEIDRTLKVKFDEGVDRPGPVPIAYVINEPKNEKRNLDTRIVVFTDADFLSNAYIGSYSNAQMGLNVINWLTDVEYPPVIQSKEIKVTRLDLTSQQKRSIVLVLILMPFMIALVGFWIWAKRHFA